MPLSAGTRLGPYEILAAIGAGGMGEVYRARDTRLDRTVAIKVLPEEVAHDVERRQRLELEARSVAALNHPHICTLFDVGQQAGVDYLVLEYLDGVTLADRLASGPPLGVADSLAIAVQIASALSAAHRSGVVHRDLKPGNIMLMKGGTRQGAPQAKLLDFGLARLDTVRAAPLGATMLPTSPANLTAQGTILGTFQYMAPEQLDGEPADPRTDIFALGAVVYEMVTGQRAFAGKSQASLIAAIMSSQPPAIHALQPVAPSALDHVIRRCLAKSPDDRWQSAGDVMLELKWVMEVGDGGPSPSNTSAQSARPGRRERIAWIASGLLGLSTIGLGYAVLSRRAPIDAPVQRLSVTLPEGDASREHPALSPDGRMLAFVLTSEGRTALWVRSLDSLSAKPLEGTDGATNPFWSADSRFIGFFAQKKLRRIEASGGPVQTICDAPSGLGGTWNRDGTIVFVPDNNSALQVVSAQGGMPQPATKVDGRGSHYAPNFLPDGRHFTFVVTVQNTRVVLLGTLGSFDTQRLFDADSKTLYAQVPSGLRTGSPGYLLYVRDSTLLAQPFNPERMQTIGDALPIANDIRPQGVGSNAAFSVSDTGILTYRALRSDTLLTWFDRDGNRLSTLGPSDRYDAVEVAPDGQRVAVERISPNNYDGRGAEVWVFGIGEERAAAFAAGSQPRWSRDGRFITFGRRLALMRKAADGTGAEQTLYESREGSTIAMSDASPDGRIEVFRMVPLAGGTATGSLWTVSPGAQKATLVPSSEARGMNGRFSPDGKWLAYSSEESGRNEVYVQPFPPTGAKWRISRDGGSRPLWRADGNELFFIATGAVNGPGPLMAVTIERAPTFRSGMPNRLLNIQFVPRTTNSYPFSVSADGQRILLLTPVDDPATTPFTVVLNWIQSLNRN